MFTFTFVPEISFCAFNVAVLTIFYQYLIEFLENEKGLSFSHAKKVSVSFINIRVSDFFLSRL